MAAVKRILLVASVLLAVLAALAVVAVLRHDDGAETVANVSGRRVTSNDLRLAVEHFHEEADREGRPFPAKGTEEYDQVETVALRLLIDRAAIEAAAARLGVHVSQAQVEAKLAAAGSAGESDEGAAIRVEAEAAFRRATARVQLLTEGVARQLAGGITVSPAAVRAYYRRHRTLYGRTPYSTAAPSIRAGLLSARRNAALAHWLAQVRRAGAEGRGGRPGRAPQAPLRPWGGPFRRPTPGRTGA